MREEACQVGWVAGCSETMRFRTGYQICSCVRHTAPRVLEAAHSARQATPSLFQHGRLLHVLQWLCTKQRLHHHGIRQEALRLRPMVLRLAATQATFQISLSVPCPAHY